MGWRWGRHGIIVGCYPRLLGGLRVEPDATIVYSVAVAEDPVKMMYTVESVETGRLGKMFPMAW